MYPNWLNILLYEHITYYIDYYTISDRDIRQCNVNIPLFLALSPHHSPPQIVLLVVVEGAEHLHGKRKYDGGVFLS